MKADDLIDAFGHIDPKYVSDAEVEIKSKSRMKRMFYVIREKIPLEKEQPAHITISGGDVYDSICADHRCRNVLWKDQEDIQETKITLWIRFS